MSIPFSAFFKNTVRSSSKSRRSSFAVAVRLACRCQPEDALRSSLHGNLEMAQLILAPALTRWLSGPGQQLGLGEAGAEWRLVVPAKDLAEALDGLFGRLPSLRGYLLDDRGVLRHHVALFIDGRVLADKSDFSAVLRPDGEVYLAQALSGG